MTLRSAVLVLAAGGALALSACGSDNDEESAESKTTPEQARAEIAAVRSSLATAMSQLRKGDKAAAENTVSEAYLQHFEKVEGPLEERDHELNEELEETLSRELRDKIKTAPAAEVEKLVSQVEDDLKTAETKLK